MKSIPSFLLDIWAPIIAAVCTLFVLEGVKAVFGSVVSMIAAVVAVGLWFWLLWLMEKRKEADNAR